MISRTQIVGWTLFGLTLWASARSSYAATFVVPTQFSTIQAAIDASTSGDTILVMPGIYPETLQIGVDLTIQATGGRDVTTIDGTGVTDSVITVQAIDFPVLLEGFTITGGSGKNVFSCINPFESRIVGGGLYAFDCDLTVLDCRFENNGHASLGTYAGGAAYVENASVTFRGTEFLRNGVEVSESVQVTFGGAVTGCGFPVSLIVEDCLFEENGRASFGGALLVDTTNALALRVSRSRFLSNRAAWGGAAAVVISLADGTGGTSEFASCEFTGNTASQAGALYLNSVQGRRVVCLNSTFRDNHASHGGGIRASSAEGGNIEIAGCVATQNTSGFGGGFRFSAAMGGIVTASNCTLAGNTASHGDGVWASAFEGGMIRLRNMLLRDDIVDSGDVELNDSNYLGSVISGSRNISQDPLFRDEAGGNFRLSYGSPSVDGGRNPGVSNRLTVDADGTSRFHDGDGDGNIIVDHGAYEYLSDPMECASGNVDAAAGGATDVLLVNGVSGGPTRTVMSSLGTPVSFDLLSSPSGAGAGRYVLWIWPGTASNPKDLVVRGERIGCTVNPTPLHGLNPRASFCVVGAGTPPLACGSATVKPGPAAVPWSLVRTLISPLTVTLQGLVEDVGSLHSSGFSVTNAVTVVVQ